jgi:hypothetical protein
LRPQAGAEWLELQVGLAWLQSYRPRQLGPFTELALTARIPLGRRSNGPLRRLTLGVDGLIPLSTQPITSGGGTTTFEAYRFGLSLALTIPLEASRFSLQAAVVVGALHVSTHGAIDPLFRGTGYTGYDHAPWAGTTALSFGPSVALTPFLRARLELAGGLTVWMTGSGELSDRIGLYHGAEEVGGIGPVYGVASLGLQADW